MNPYQFTGQNFMGYEFGQGSAPAQPDDIMGALNAFAQQLQQQRAMQLAQQHAAMMAAQQQQPRPIHYPPAPMHPAAMAQPPMLHTVNQQPELWTVPAGLGVFDYSDASTDLAFKVSVLPQSNFAIERLFCDFVSDDAAATALISEILVAGKPQTPDTGEDMPWTMFRADTTYSRLALKAIKDGKKFEIVGRINKVPATGKVATVSWGAYGRMFDND